MHVPVAPGASFHLPPKLEGLRTPRLQPVVELASARPGSCSRRIDAGGWARYRNPIPVLSGPVAWAQLLDNTAFMADYQDILAEFDSYMANGADHWFAAPPRRTSSRARSPTSAPSTASTSRSASTPAASASSPATT